MVRHGLGRKKDGGIVMFSHIPSEKDSLIPQVIPKQNKIELSNGKYKVGLNNTIQIIEYWARVNF